MTKEIKSGDQNTGLSLDLVKYFSAMDKKKPLKMNYPRQKSATYYRTGAFQNHIYKKRAPYSMELLSSRLGDLIPMVITEDEGAGAVFIGLEYH
jgi:hypothetical protein